MRLLKFNVNAQQIEKDPECDFENLVAGSKNYLKAYFNLPEDWQNCSIAASFWRGKNEYAVLLKDSMCDIPPEVTIWPTFQVSVTCLKDNVCIPTNKTLVRQEVRR